MPDFLHRTTKQFLNSVSYVDLPEPIANYIEEPDLSAVTGQPARYWVITGDIVSLADQATRDAIDAQIAADRLTQRRATAVSLIDSEDKIDYRAIIQSLNRRINYLTNRVIELQNQNTAMITSTGNAQAIRDAGATITLSATNTRALPEAIQDYKDDINAGLAD